MNIHYHTVKSIYFWVLNLGNYNDQKTEDRPVAGQVRQAGRAAMFQSLLLRLIIWSCLGINCVDVSTCLNSKEIKETTFER